MKVIHKYPLYAPDNVIEMPFDAEVLHVHAQNGEAMLWVMHDTDSELTENRRFIWIGTGKTFEVYGGSYVGTVHLDWFVWHVWEVPE